MSLPCSCCLFCAGTILPGAGGSRSPKMSNGEIDEYDDRFREVGARLMTESYGHCQYYRVCI